MYFEFSLGSWDFTKFKNVEVGQQIGIWFSILFLLIMLVLFMNFLIAILSQVFSYYEDKKQGLYYEVLVKKINRYGYDPMYGSIACAYPPMNLLVYPCQWATSLFDDSPHNKRIKEHINNTICHVLYLPYSLLTTVVFTICNLALAPVAYLRHSFRLLASISKLKGFSNKSSRFGQLLLFMVSAPLFLLFSVLFEFFTFFIYLYRDPTSKVLTPAGMRKYSSISVDTYLKFIRVVNSYRRPAQKTQGYSPTF